MAQDRIYSMYYYYLTALSNKFAKVIGEEVPALF